MADLVEYERRIAAALERIESGLDGLSRPEPAAAGPSVEDDLLRAELQSERLASAELREVIAGVADREAVLRSQYEERIERLTRHLDVQGLELQRMRKTSLTLREELRHLREAATMAAPEPLQINRALLAELEAMRAARLSEMAELDEIAQALDQHLTEAENA